MGSTSSINKIVAMALLFNSIRSCVENLEIHPISIANENPGNWDCSQVLNQFVGNDQKLIFLSNRRLYKTYII